MKQLRVSLFEAVTFCHDNDKTFIKDIIQRMDVYTLNGIYFSGSQCLVTYTDNFGADFNHITKTLFVFNWMEKEGFKL